MAKIKTGRQCPSQGPYPASSTDGNILGHQFGKSKRNRKSMSKKTLFKVDTGKTIKQCTHVHIAVTKWCIVGYGTDASWDLCNRYPGSVRRQVIDSVGIDDVEYTGPRW